MLRRFLCAFALAAGATRAPAIDYTWSTGTSGSWADTTRWSPGGAPGAGDNATINAAGTYTVAFATAQAANNVTLSGAAATVSAGGDFTLGGTLLLAAGSWATGASNSDTVTTFTGGTVTRGMNGTGLFHVGGTVRFQNTQVQGQALRLNSQGSLVRMAGTAAFTPGSVVTFNPTQVYANSTGVVWDQDTVVDNVTINTGPGVQIGLAGGTSLTLGPNAVISQVDPNSLSAGAIGRHFYVPNPNALVTLTNQGTIRNNSPAPLYIGRYTTAPQSDPRTDVNNSGLIESQGYTMIHASTFRNQAGGVVRVLGEVFVFGLTDWSNQGTFEVGNGVGTRLLMGGNFKSANVGAITRTGTNAVGFYAARMDNANSTFGVSAATGDYILYGDGDASGADIVGGSLTATGGAKFVVRTISVASGYDPVYLTGVQVGAGALRFENGGHLVLRGGATLAANETVTLTAPNAQLWLEQTGQVDNLSVELGGAGNGSSFGVVDDNDLTLGPDVLVRKTGAGTARLFSALATVTTGTPSLTNLGTIRVEAGTLSTQSTSEFTNRGLADVAAGATWNAQSGTGGLRTGAGGTVRGAGTVTGGLTFTGADTHLRPGSAAATGRLTSTGDVTLSSGATFHARLNGTAAGTGHDQLAVAGTVTLADATLDLALGYAPGAADVVFLVTNDGTDAVSGTFAGLPDGATVTVGGYAATVRYTANADTGLLTGGNDVALVNFAPVPEPGLVLGVAALGLAAVRRVLRAAGLRAGFALVWRSGT